jgi:hypothetical protein
MINAKTTDLIRIEVDEINGRAVTLTGEQWLKIFDAYNQDRLEDYSAYSPGLAD